MVSELISLTTFVDRVSGEFGPDDTGRYSFVFSVSSDSKTLRKSANA